MNHLLASAPLPSHHHPSSQILTTTERFAILWLLIEHADNSNLLRWLISLAVTNSRTIRSSNGVHLGILIPQMAIPHFLSIFGFVAKALNRPGCKPAITTEGLFSWSLPIENSTETEHITILRHSGRARKHARLKSFCRLEKLCLSQLQTCMIGWDRPGDGVRVWQYFTSSRIVRVSSHPKTISTLPR